MLGMVVVQVYQEELVPEVPVLVVSVLAFRVHLELLEALMVPEVLLLPEVLLVLAHRGVLEVPEGLPVLEVPEGMSDMGEDSELVVAGGSELAA